MGFSVTPRNLMTNYGKRQEMIFSPFHINCYAGPEYHIEPVLIYDDLFDLPPDQLFIIFLIDGRLLPQEFAHFDDPFPQLVPASVVCLRLLFLIAQPINLIGDMPNIRSSAGQLQ